MSSEQLQELHEGAEHARHDPDKVPVSFTMAVLAVLVATVALLGHRAHTEEILTQTRVTDQWAYYQAKTIRRHNDQMFVDMSAFLDPKDPGQLARLREKYASEAERYSKEQKDLEADARKLEEETRLWRRRTDYYDLAEVLLEVSLIITSITLLSEKRGFWYAGIFIALAGSAVALGGVVG
ncbi:MAG TPA: DUF4337 domain-containing protein [Terriglobales bacterium]|nr:DUF4337 domain-containing protein [Terriglobales bacterium]